MVKADVHFKANQILPPCLPFLLYGKPLGKSENLEVIILHKFYSLSPKFDLYVFVIQSNVVEYMCVWGFPPLNLYTMLPSSPSPHTLARHVCPRLVRFSRMDPEGKSVDLQSYASCGVRQERKCTCHKDKLCVGPGSGLWEVFRKHWCGASTVREWGVLMSNAQQSTWVGSSKQCVSGGDGALGTVVGWQG
ncbi:hypothetical protein HJG60_010124 [Phyllostomus discolor]|uniref:Uncharacterized protein n=1 Tax=Phyllostomus discolor TaxID=89673 RepID=A0A834EK07_9CHIR|nr:hypothetical protein HJG60_010124 [Phyllostomus discolor]